MKRPPRGSLFLSEVCGQWEQALDFEDPGPELIVARLGMVLAANAPAWEKLLLPIRLGAGGPLGKTSQGWGMQWWSWIHIDDVVHGLLHLLDTNQAGCFNFSSPEPLRQRDFAQQIATPPQPPKPHPHAPLLRCVWRWGDSPMSSS